MTMLGIFVAVVAGGMLFGIGVEVGNRSERNRLLNATNYKPAIRITPNSTINLDDLRGWLAEHGVDLQQPEPPTIEVADMLPYHQHIALAQSHIDDALDHYPVDSIENRILNDCIKTMQCVIEMEPEESEVSA
ncbi:hypothetical protein CIG75_19050 [Tumebacillus algifaecis]|uniref:Uncharacterized protein n=1 Tax=Tumebacillus algifaecis TaxID=1214604 RepID=A0A223D5G2_9BACL|nr:hypothetical protein [Tumebacillus algifaecis]ASS76832.1 hypothetical protein CIG75_19050 [Tumebacillus algifaecis]